MLLQARQHREARQHFQRARRQRRFGQFGGADQLVVDLRFLGDAQHVGHLDHVDAVDEGLVVLVVLERAPLGLVRVRHHDAGEGDRADVFRADVVAFLRRRQQRVQHLDRRLEHLDEFEHALVGAVEAARIGVASGSFCACISSLRMSTLPTSEETSWLFSSPGSVLAMPIWRSREGFTLATRNLVMSPPNSSSRFSAPRAHQAGQAPARNAVFLLELFGPGFRIEQRERALEDRREIVAGLQHVDRLVFHQRLDALGERGLAAADRAEQVEDLLALFETLRALAEEGDDALDRLFHAVEFGERRIDPDRAVQEDAPEPRILRRVDHLRFADRRKQALVRTCVHQRVLPAAFEVFGDRHHRLATGLEGLGVAVEEIARHRSSHVQDTTPVRGTSVCSPAPPPRMSRRSSKACTLREASAT